MDPQTAKWIIWIGAGLAALLIVKVFSAPLKLVFKLLLNTLLGFAFLVIFNFFGEYIGVTIGVNAINAVTVAILGPAGLAVLLFARWIML